MGVDGNNGVLLTFVSMVTWDTPQAYHVKRTNVRLTCVSIRQLYKKKINSALVTFVRVHQPYKT